MTRFPSDFKWLGGRRSILVRYVRHDYVETGVNCSDNFFVNRLASLLHIVNRKFTY